MDPIISGPRKQRRRRHILGDLSAHYVVGFNLHNGYTAQPVQSDYGYDLLLTTYDAEGYVEPDQTLIQLKAAET